MVAMTRPIGHTTFRFHWDYNNREQSGRGSIMFAAPDSLRLDFRGPIGMGAGSAVAIGDEQQWAEPRDKVKELVPSYPLLWAVIGVARPPGAGWRAETSRTPSHIALRYTRGADTVDYQWIVGAKTTFVAEVREQGKAVGRVVTELDSVGHPSRSRLDVAANPVRLELSFEKAPKPLPFQRDLWLAPHDQ